MAGSAARGRWCNAVTIVLAPEGMNQAPHLRQQNGMEHLQLPETKRITHAAKKG